MPPKKKGAKGAKGKKKKAEEAPYFTIELNANEKLKRAEARIQSLERILDERTAYVMSERAKTAELRSLVLNYQGDMIVAHDERTDIWTDFTRMYRAKQDELCEHINKLENEKAELLDAIELQRLAVEELRRDTNYEIDVKQRILEEQRTKIVGVTEDFHEMLKDTLNRLVERVAQMQEDSAIIGKGRVEFENLDEVRTFMKKVQATKGDNQPTTLDQQLDSSRGIESVPLRPTGSFSSKPTSNKDQTSENEESGNSSSSASPNRIRTVVSMEVTGAS